MSEKWMLSQNIRAHHHINFVLLLITAYKLTGTRQIQTILSCWVFCYHRLKKDFWINERPLKIVAIIKMFHRITEILHGKS